MKEEEKTIEYADRAIELLEKCNDELEEIVPLRYHAILYDILSNYTLELHRFIRKDNINVFMSSLDNIINSKNKTGEKQ